jgi:hypothetical protein
MPTSVDQAKIQAAYPKGVLALRLPKHAAAIPKGISITGEQRRRTWGRSGAGDRPDRPRRVV